MAKKAEKVEKVYWGKGPRKETVEYGGAKFTLRGLTYREFLYVSSLKRNEADAISFRLCLDSVENLLALDEDGKEEVIELTWETIDIDGKETKVLSEQSYEIFQDSILLIGQILAVILELSQLTKEEALTARIFRKNK